MDASSSQYREWKGVKRLKVVGKEERGKYINLCSKHKSGYERVDWGKDLGSQIGKAESGEKIV